MNLGIGGDEVQHATWRVQNGEVDAIDPAVAVVLIGEPETKSWGCGVCYPLRACG